MSALARLLSQIVPDLPADDEAAKAVVRAALDIVLTPAELSTYRTDGIVSQSTNPPGQSAGLLETSTLSTTL